MKIICVQASSLQIITKFCVRYTYEVGGTRDIDGATEPCFNLVGYHSLCCG
jgi:hypothetical protein